MIEYLVNDSGILLRRDAIAAGVDDNALRRGVDAGFIVRMRQGIYALAAVWAQANALERHRLLLEGVRLLYGDGVAASHISGCVEQGGPTWGMDLSVVHLTDLTGKGERSVGKVVHHRGLSQEAGVAVVDWYLQNALTTIDELRQLHERMAEWPGSIGLHRILGLVDGKAESVGETRTRLMCRAHRLPPPIAQLEIHDHNGRLAGRVDFAWPQHRVMLEFDGMVKYHRHRRPGETIEDMVMREKQREDRLRELTGWTMIRITWADLARPEATVARILRALQSAA